MGTALPVQAVLEPTHGTWRGSAFLSHPELSVGVLRLHVGQDMPRKRGCVGFTGGHTEQGHPPQAVQDIQSYCIRRVPCIIHFVPPLQTFLKGLGYVVRDAGTVSLGWSIFLSPELEAQQQWGLARWLTGTSNKLDYLAAFPTKRRLVRLCHLHKAACGSAVAGGVPRP